MERTGKQAGTLLLTLAALATGLLPLLADANRSALFDPDWTGHAHYHTSMVIVIGLELALLALWLLWRVRGSFGVSFASLLLAIFWGGYVAAQFVPGVALQSQVAPNAAQISPNLWLLQVAIGGAPVGLTLNLWLILGMLALVLVGYALARTPAPRPRPRYEGRRSGRIMLSVLALITLVGAPVFDFNADHVFNPNWPPYARYHVAVHIPVTMALMASVLWLLWHTWSRTKPDTTFGLAVALVMAFWLTFYTAELVPGTANVDPGQSVPSVGGFQVYQLTAAIPFTLLVALAVFLYVRGRAHVSATA